MNYKVVVIGLLLIALPVMLLYAIPPAEGEYQGQTTSQWIARTTGGSAADRLAAAKALGTIGKAEYESVKGTRISLMNFHDKLGGTRCTATMVPPLMSLLRDPDASVRSAAVDALAGLREYADDDLLKDAVSARDPMIMWGVYTVYLREMRAGRNTTAVLDCPDGHRLLDLTEGEPHPDYADLIAAERGARTGK